MVATEALNTNVTAVVIAVLSGSGIAAIATLRRAPSQNRLDVVQMQHTLYQEVQTERDAVNKRLDECELERDRLRRELAANTGEIDFLRERIEFVERAMRERHRASLEESGILPREERREGEQQS